MSEEQLAMKGGKLVVFSTGEYSDYGYFGSFVALQDVTVPQMYELADEVKKEAEKVEADGGWADPHSMFTAAMIRKGWLLDVNLTEIHIGSYGRIELDV